MRLHRRGLTSGFVTAAAVLIMASTAWACYSETNGGACYMSVSPNQGQAGDVVLAEGGNFEPNRSLSLAWSADGTSATRPIATAVPNAQGSFIVRVSVPELRTGVWYLLATQDSLSKATSFQVNSPTAASDREATPSPASSKAGSGSAVGQDEATPATSGASGGQAEAVAFPTRSSASPTPEAQAPAAEQASSPPAAPAGASSSPQRPATATPAGSPTRARVAPGPQLAPATEDQDAAVSARVVGGEMWAGLSGQAPTPGTSLVDLPVPDRSDPIGQSAAVLSIGLAALAVGFGLSETRRRRQMVDKGTS